MFFSTKENIQILYRHYHDAFPLSKKERPGWFSYQACFNSLMSTLKCQDIYHVTLNIIFDRSGNGASEDFIYKFSSFKRNRHLSIRFYEFEGGSDSRSVLATKEYLKKMSLDGTEWIYWLENDYLHRDGWVEAIKGLQYIDGEYDYVTLYDHPDKYAGHKGFHPIHRNLESKIFFDGSRYWRTTPSTTFTFLSRAKTIFEDIDLVGTCNDHQFFTELNLNRGKKLISPLPGYSTHVMKNLFSPGVDWRKVSDCACE